jgi:RNA polymerase sigma-70 factor (ECF subfamily)
MASFDADYIQRLIDRDPETGRHFATYFGELLWIKLRTRVQSHQMAEDIRQETLLRVLGKIRAGELKKPECLGAFVSSFANNVMMEHFRGESKYCEIADEGWAMIDPKGSVHDAYVSDERKEQVRAVLNEMNEKDRELLKAVFLQEQDKDQVCREFGVNRAYLRVLLHRARGRFRAAFSETYTHARKQK